MKNLAALVLACSLALPAVSAFAQPTDEQVASLISKLQEAAKEGTDGLDTAAQAAMKDMPLDTLTLSQITSIVQTRMLDFTPSLAKPVTDRLAVLSKSTGADGAAAAELSLQTAGLGINTEAEGGEAKYAEATATRLNEVLAHPGIAEHVRAPKGGRNIFVAISMLSDMAPATLAQHKLIEKVAPLITTDLSSESTANLGALIEPMLASEAGVSSELRSQILAKMQAASQAALTREGEPSDPARKRLVARIKDNMTMSQSKFARGELIGGEAPEIEFTWTSKEAFGAKSVTKLSDLKGKVVMIDFWATWCGPCIRAFPSVRELQARYKDYDVVILGVTSLQGSHTQRKGSERATIDTTNDPAREYLLMSEFMTDMEMTWPVVFSSSNVFNPEYGVRGIPHLVIIDPAGKVRHNALRPGKASEEAEKIDALLKEFNLKMPPAPMD